MSDDSVSVEEKKFLQMLVDLKITKITPKVTPDGIIFKELEDIEEPNWSSIHMMVKTLAGNEYLKEEDHDRAIFCPSCDSPHVYSKYACPTNRSIFIRRVTLLQHQHCGYQGEKHAFINREYLHCPKCSTELGRIDAKPPGDNSKEDYRIIGTTYECEKSGHRFEKPLVLHFCPKCGAIFDYKTARYEPIYAYSLEPKVYELLKGDPEIDHLITPILSYLSENGYKAELEPSLKGVSGSNHRFDILATKADKRIVFDYSFGDSNKLVALLGKKMDITGTEAVLIDFNGNEELLNLGKVYNIIIINPNNNDWQEKLEELIKTQLSTQKKKSRFGLYGDR